MKTTKKITIDTIDHSTILNKLYPNYKDPNGRICLVRCPKCGEENYALSVNSGICAWCGFDANAEQKQL